MSEFELYERVIEKLGYQLKSIVQHPLRSYIKSINLDYKDYTWEKIENKSYIGKFFFIRYEIFISERNGYIISFKEDLTTNRPGGTNPKGLYGNHKNYKKQDFYNRYKYIFREFKLDEIC